MYKMYKIGYYCNTYEPRKTILKMKLLADTRYSVIFPGHQYSNSYVLRSTFKNQVIIYIKTKKGFKI